jgi:hypothetical protein
MILNIIFKKNWNNASKQIADGIIWYVLIKINDIQIQRK